MSGHSKWSKVKHQKATTDVVKAKAFTKAARAITVAVNEGGGSSDPSGNFKLRLAIEQARAVNMPKENIDRAIAKATGEGGAVTESLVYEAYGPGGSAFIIEAATENKQRTVSFIKNILDRKGGSLATQGAVLYQFSKIGVISLDLIPGKGEDELLSLALEVQAQDIKQYDEHIEVYTTLVDLQRVQEALEQRGICVNTAEIIYSPIVASPVDDQWREKIDMLIATIEDLDDVLRVYTNIL